MTTNPPEPTGSSTPPTGSDAAPQGSRSNDGSSTPEQTSPTSSNPGSGRFAVYDTRYERFVGSVTDKKPSKADAKKLAGHDDVEVREV